MDGVFKKYGWCEEEDGVNRKIDGVKRMEDGKRMEDVKRRMEGGLI